MKRIAMGISTAALAIAGTAFAAHHEGRPNPDGNGDGVVTRAEAQAHSAAMFAKLDADANGKLDQTDREVHREHMRTRIFARLDGDNNGSITRDEFMAFKGPEKHAGDKAEAGGPGARRHKGMDMGMGMGMRGHRGGMMMKMADTDNDGAISQSEFASAAERRFARIDANNDGQITRDERETHRKEMRENWRERKTS